MPANATPTNISGRLAAAAIGQFAPIRADGQPAAAGDPIIGFTQASATAGSRVPVAIDGSSIAWSGAAIADGSLVQVGPSGTVVTATDGGCVIGVALNAASAAGEKVEVLLSSSNGVVSGQTKYPGTLIRLSQNPIYSTSTEKAGFALGAVYWPWVVPAYKYLANPLAKYYLYYSTDHSTWGGIGLALSDSPTGPFVQYTPSGPSTQDPNCPGTYTNGHPNQAGAIYMDAQAGSTTPNTVWGTPGAAPTPGTINYMQCETPSVVWDEQIGMFRMFYQVGSVNGRAVFSRPADMTATPALYETFYSATGAQSTLSATSPDGITWTKDRNFIIQPIWQSHSPGDGHSGYFLPSRYAGQWSAYHLWGSTNYARFALSRASGVGASEWQTDNRELGPWSHICGLSSTSAAMGLNWNNLHLIEGKDGPIGIGTISEFVSGGSARESALCVVPMSRDLRKPLCKPSITSFVSGALSWESTDLKGVSVMQDGGKTYVYYGCKTAGGAYNVGVMQYV